MKNKNLYYFIVVALFSIMPIASIGQTCDLIDSLIDYHWKEKYDYSLICKKPDIYYFYGNDYLTDVKTNLSSVFSQKITDSLINIMRNNSANVNFDRCINPKLKLISKRKAKRIYNKNQKKDLEYFSEKSLNSFTVFFITPPIYYKEYVIVQYRGVVRSLYSVTRLLLFKHTDNKWNFYKVICSSAS